MRGPKPKNNAKNIKNATMKKHAKRKRAVIIVGPESSGTNLVKTCVIGATNASSYNFKSKVPNYNDWVYRFNGFPMVRPAIWVDSLEQARRLEADSRNVYIVLCIRDKTLSEYSVARKFTPHDLLLAKEHKNKAKGIILSVVSQRHFPYYIFSYETFMYLGKPYLKLFYDFLSMQSDFCPKLIDGNEKRLRALLK